MHDYVIAKYIRLSIEDVKSDSMSIENQRLMLNRHIAAMDIPDAEVLEFVDNGNTGTNFERPAMQELLEMAKTGMVDCIIVKDFSRFGRSLIEAGYFIEQVFPLFRIRFISVSDAFDSDEHKGDTGGLEVSFKLLAHEYYSKDLSQKVKSAKQVKMRNGEAITKHCAFGYVKGSNGRLEIDEVAASTVREIFSLASDGLGPSDICKQLYLLKRPTPADYKKGRDLESHCIWSQATVCKILHDEQYIGTYVAGKTRMPEPGGRPVKTDESKQYRIANYHPAIIDASTFEQVAILENARSARRRKPRKQGKSEGLQKTALAGKVTCGCCGKKMRLDRGKDPMFRCAYTNQAIDEPCHGLKVNVGHLEMLVVDILKKQLAVVSDTDLNTAALSEAQVAFAKQVEGCIDERRSLYERLISGEISSEDYHLAKAAFDETSDCLSHPDNGSNGSVGAIRKLHGLKDIAGSIKSLVQGSEACSEQLRAIVDALVDVILVYPGGKVEVVWKDRDFFSEESAVEFAAR
jgi:DNA invertase Pin-like site-specific DNA recombinase